MRQDETENAIPCCVTLAASVINLDMNRCAGDGGFSKSALTSRQSVSCPAPFLAFRVGKRALCLIRIAEVRETRRCGVIDNARRVEHSPGPGPRANQERTPVTPHVVTRPQSPRDNRRKLGRTAVPHQPGHSLQNAKQKQRRFCPGPALDSCDFSARD